MLAPNPEVDSPCPLCDGAQTRRVHDQRIGGAEPIERPFYQCATCELVFVPRRHQLSREQERAVYDQHQNHPDDPRYRDFLSRLVSPLHRKLQPGDRGLDFGCGPGPALSVMMRELGMQCDNYDPFYFNDASLLDNTYDFIASSEVFEHLAAPEQVIAQLHSMLVPNGWLGVMTKRLRSTDALNQWHYIRDPTHVSFFSDTTFRWIGKQFGFDVHLVSADVVLLQRTTSAPAANDNR